jgi:predicted ATPase
MHAHRYELMTTAFNSALAEGLLMANQAKEALETIDGALEAVKRNGDLFNVAELLRIKGQIFAAGPTLDPPRAEAIFLQSLEVARANGALAWELRTATSLAGFWHAQRRFEEGVQLLRSVLSKFTEGFGCSDFVKATKMLDECARLAAVN